MKRWLQTGLILAAALILPRLSHPATDVGDLEPVAAVRITQTENGIVLQTDTGASGFGGTLAEAAEDLQAGASAEVFLDTAEYLLIDGGIPREILEFFRPGCYVCRVEGKVDLEEAVAYLSVHRPEQTLTRLRAGEKLEQTLKAEEGEWRLE